MKHGYIDQGILEFAFWVLNLNSKDPNRIFFLVGHSFTKPPALHAEGLTNLGPSASATPTNLNLLLIGKLNSRCYKRTPSLESCWQSE